MRFSVFNAILFLLLLFCLFVCLFVLRFCGGGLFFFEVSNRPSNGFLFCKLKISLSKITDLPFRSIPCLK